MSEPFDFHDPRPICLILPPPGVVAAFEIFNLVKPLIIPDSTMNPVFASLSHWSLIPGLLRDELAYARKHKWRLVLVVWSYDVLHAVTELSPEDRADVCVYRVAEGKAPVRFSGEEMVTVTRERMEIR